MAQGSITIYEHGDYEFVCWYWETSRSWGHEVRLCKNGTEVGNARIRYWNRTWEVYTFQSTMYSALEDYKKRRLQRYLDDYKYKYGLKGYDENHQQFEKPFPRGVKKQLIEDFEKQPEWKDLENFVKDRR